MRVSRPRVKVLSIDFDPIRQAEVRQRLQTFLSQPRRARSFLYLKPYVEFFIDQPTIVQALLQEADLVVADSVAVQWAASYLADGQPTLRHWLWSLAAGLRRPQWLKRVIPDRGSGVDTTQALLRLAEKQGWKVGILGGPRDIEQTKQAVHKRFPRLRGPHAWSGYFEPIDEAALVREIRSQRLDILFVAMGYPRQELFIAKHDHDLARVLIGEGGTFDYDQMGGPIKRAPQAWRRVGLEWLWRLLQQPWRLKRQLAIPKFMWRVYRAAKTPKKT